MLLGCVLSLMFWMTIAAIWVNPWWGVPLIILISLWLGLQAYVRWNHPLW